MLHVGIWNQGMELLDHMILAVLPLIEKNERPKCEIRMPFFFDFSLF
jgi:hypothetical protein